MFFDGMAKDMGNMIIAAIENCYDHGLNNQPNLNKKEWTSSMLTYFIEGLSNPKED